MSTFDPSPAEAQERVRISVTERLLPALALGVAAASGAVGALMVQTLFASLRTAETAGFGSLFSGLTRIHLVTGSVLVVALLLSVPGLVVSIVRMFMTTTTASPAGVRLFALGLICLISPSLIYYALTLITEAALKPAGVDLVNVASAVELLCYGAMAATGLSLLVVPVFSFVPLKSRLGRKYSPTVALLLLQIAVICLAAMFLLGARTSATYIR